MLSPLSKDSAKMRKETAMLFIVEGRFFSSSASGYTQGFSLMILGCKSTETQMRVLPWNQHQLIKQEMSPQLQQLLQVVTD